MSELVKQLRSANVLIALVANTPDGKTLYTQAADEIERLEAEAVDLKNLMRYYIPGDTLNGLWINTHEKAEACRDLMDRPASSLVPIQKGVTP